MAQGKTGPAALRFVVMQDGSPPAEGLALATMTGRDRFRIPARVQLLRVEATTAGARCLGAYLAALGVPAWEFASAVVADLWGPDVAQGHADALAPLRPPAA